MLPISSSPMVQPASSHHFRNSARPSASASVTVWRLLPPATPGPIFAISIRLSHSRSPSMRMFFPGALITLLLSLEFDLDEAHRSIAAVDDIVLDPRRPAIGRASGHLHPP